MAALSLFVFGILFLVSAIAGSKLALAAYRLYFTPEVYNPAFKAKLKTARVTTLRRA